MEPLPKKDARHAVKGEGAWSAWCQEQACLAERGKGTAASGKQSLFAKEKKGPSVQ